MQVISDQNFETFPDKIFFSSKLFSFYTFVLSSSNMIEWDFNRKYFKVQVHFAALKHCAFPKNKTIKNYLFLKLDKKLFLNLGAVETGSMYVQRRLV